MRQQILSNVGRYLASAIVISFALVGGASVTLAGEDHKHDKGPHGGEVVGFGAYHLEAHRSGAAIDFYLLDDEAKGKATMNKQDGGNVSVICGKEKHKTEIDAGKFSEATAKASASGKCKAIVSLKSGGKTLSAKYTFSE